MKNFFLIFVFMLSFRVLMAQDNKPSLIIECEKEGSLSSVEVLEDVWNYDHVFLKGRFNSDDLQVINDALSSCYIKVVNCKDAFFVKSGNDNHMENEIGIIEDGTFPRNFLQSEVKVLPSSLKKIIPWQYALCNKVILPDGIERIEQYAFEWERLSSINLPQSISHIGSGAFYSALFETLKMPDNITIIEDSCIYFPVKDKLHLPANLEEIAWSGVNFGGKELTLPAKLRRIAPNGLTATNIEKLHTLAPDPPLCDTTFSFTDLQGMDKYIDKESGTNSCCLSGIDKTKCILYVPKGSIEKYKAAHEWDAFTDIREESDDFVEDMTGFNEWDDVEYEYSDLASIKSKPENVDFTKPRYFDIFGREFNNPINGVNIIVYPGGKIRKEIRQQ